MCIGTSQTDIDANAQEAPVLVIEPDPKLSWVISAS